ncbi:MAG: hypothetical protein ACOCZ6_01300 [Nanoarchaeota archaeon]
MGRSGADSKLTQYNIVREWVVRNSVKNVPAVQKGRCESLACTLNSFLE